MIRCFVTETWSEWPDDGHDCKPSSPHLLRNLDVLAGVKLLQSSEIHGLLQQGDDIGVESLPVGVLKVILLALDHTMSVNCTLYFQTHN